MEDLVRFGLLGLGIGALYVLAAQGLIVIFRGSGVLNLALGAIGMVGAYVAWELQVNQGMPFLVALAAGGLSSALVGALVQQFIMRPLRKRSPLVRVIATLGVLITLQSIAILYYGSAPKIVKSSLPLDRINVFGDVFFTADRLVLLLIAIAVTFGLYVFYRYTRFGLGTTAVAENEVVASSLGWSPSRVAIINWSIGSALAGVAAVLIMPIVTLQPSVMTNLVLAATSTALVAGFRSFPIALLAGLAIGVTQTEVSSLVPGLPGIGQAVPFAFIVVWMMLRGQGIPQRDYILQRLPSVGTGQIRWGLVGAALLIVGAMVFSVTPLWIDSFIVTITISIIVLSIIVLTGYAGQLSLAQFSIAIFGAYVAGRLTAVFEIPFLLAIAAGVIATVPLGLLFALPAVRTRGINLAILTLGLGTVLELVLFKNQDLTGGIQGTLLPDPTIAGINLSSNEFPERYAIFTLCVLLLVILVVSNIRRGRVGRRLLAVRANERAAAALGIGIVSAKMYAFGIGAGIAALGGVLYVFRNTAASYSTFTNFDSILLIGNAMIGGIGYLAGAPLAGTLFGGGFNARILNSLGDGIDAWIPLIGGVALIIMVLANQDGIVKEVMTNAQLMRRYLREGIRVPSWIILPGVGFVLGIAAVALIPDLSWWTWFRLEIALIGIGVAAGMTAVRGGGLATRIFGLLLAIVSIALDGGSVTVTMLVVLMATITLAVLKRNPLRAGLGAAVATLGVALIGAAVVYAVQGPDRGGLALALIVIVIGATTWILTRETPTIGAASAALGLPVALAAVLALLGSIPETTPLIATSLIALAIAPLFADVKMPAATGAGVAAVAVAVPIAAYLLDWQAVAAMTLILAQISTLATLLHTTMSARQRISAFVVTEALLGALLMTMLTMYPVAAVFAVLAIIKLIIGPRDLPGAPIKMPEVSATIIKVPPKTLTVEGLTVRYGGTTAVDSVDLEIAPGKIIGLIGPNGAGKTSLIDAVTGFTKPAAGRIQLDGLDMTNWVTTRRSRAGVGRSFQALELFEDMTVIDNLRAASEPRDFISYFRDLVWPVQAQPPQALVNAVQEFKLEDDLPRGVDDLSYGKRRLLAIARAVAGQPSVLLLDEPAAGLNESETRELAALVKRLADEWGMSILLVEHDINFVMSVCDDIVVLDFGCKISHGSPDHVRNDPAVIAAYLGDEDPEDAHHQQELIDRDETGVEAKP